MATRNSPQSTNSFPVIQGGIAGAASFLGGYLVTLVVVAVTESQDLTEDLFEGAGWVYYNAQFTDVEVTVTGGSGGLGGFLDGTTFNYITDEQILDSGFTLEAPSIVYRLIPVIVLLAAGFMLAQYVGARTPQNGALAGATLLVGTAPLALVGTFIFSLEESGIELSPILADGLLFVGVLFPLVFGVIGGVLSTQLNSSNSRR